MSKTLSAFETVQKLCGDGFKLFGDQLLVEILPETDGEIKTASGLVVSASTSQSLKSVNSSNAVFCRVLLVGEGYFDSEKKEDIPLETAVGDILVTSSNLPVSFSRFGMIPMTSDFRLALLNESSIIMRFYGEEEYQSFMTTLKQGLGN